MKKLLKGISSILDIFATQGTELLEFSSSYEALEYDFEQIRNDIAQIIPSFAMMNSESKKKTINEERSIREQKVKNIQDQGLYLFEATKNEIYNNLRNWEVPFILLNNCANMIKEQEYAIRECYEAIQDSMYSIWLNRELDEFGIRSYISQIIKTEISNELGKLNLDTNLKKIK